MPISYVGGQVGGRLGSTSSTSVTFALTGGSDSTPQAGDLVVVSIGAGTLGRTPTLNITGYTALAAQYGSDNFDVAFRVLYKRMGTTPDTSVTIPQSGNTEDAQAWVIQVFRGVDETTPLDVTATGATGDNTALANPPAITPVTAGAWVVVCGAGAYSGTGANYIAPSNFETNFLSTFANDTNDVVIGAGYWDGWTSGAVDPAQFTGGNTSTSNSWASRTLALRPAAEPYEIRITWAEARYVPGAALPNTYNASLTEAATAAESQTTQRTQSASLTEAASAAESQTTQRTQSTALTEAATAAESLGASLALEVSTTENSALADSVGVSRLTSAAHTEAVSVLDAATLSRAQSAATTEVVSASDNAASAVVLTASRTEATLGADTAAATASYAQLLTEVVSATDLSGYGSIYVFGITEPAAATDVSTGVCTRVASCTESATSVDTFSHTVTLNILATEAATGVDSASSTLAYQTLVAEVANAIAPAALAAEYLVSAVEAATASETVNEDLGPSLVLNEASIASVQGLNVRPRVVVNLP